MYLRPLHASRGCSQKRDNASWARRAFILIFLCRHYSEGLADILLMDTNDVISVEKPVVAFDDNGDFVFSKRMTVDCALGKPRFRASMRQKCSFSECPAKLAGRWLQDMGRRYAAGRNAPTPVLQAQRGFWLSACKAELPGIAS
jgi:hypothetical protein